MTSLNAGYPVDDFRLRMAEKAIYDTYGDRASIIQKNKFLRKFGTNSDLDVGTDETIWEQGGDETYIFDNLIDTISSSSTSDVGQVIRVEGHTISGTEAAPEYTFAVQNAIVDGQNKVTLATPLARCSRMVNNSLAPLVGAVRSYQDTAITGGVPDDPTLVHAAINTGFQQTRKCATTFSNVDYFIMTQVKGSVRRAGQSVADFFLEIRQPGGVFREQLIFTSSRDSGTTLLPLDPPIIVPKNSDVRIRAGVTANNTELSAYFGGYIAKVL